MRSFIFLLLLFFFLKTNAQSISLNQQWVETDGEVNAIEIDSVNKLVYMGGAFTEVRNHTPFGTSVNNTTGLVNSNFQKPNGKVNVSISDGLGGWYIGGSFSRVGDSVRNNIAHLNSAGEVTNKFSNLGFDYEVYDLALSGSVLYVGGNFTRTESYKRNGSLVDIVNGTINVQFPDFDGKVGTCVPDGNGGFYVGGLFNMVGDSLRKNLAHINSSGIVTTWKPDPNGEVMSLKINSGKLFVSGIFGTISGQIRYGIASFDLVTELITPFSPQVSGYVNAMEFSGGTIYIGGGFTMIGLTPRAYIAALNSTSGVISSWNPGCNQIVKDLAIYGSNLIVGGLFTQINGTARNYLAQVDLTTGVVQTWNPNPSYYIYKLKTSGTNLFVGGGFNNIAGQARTGLAKFDLTTGNLTTWNPIVAGVSISVDNIEFQGSNVYIAGSFNLVNGQDRNEFACLDVNTAALQTWNPNATNLSNGYTVTLVGSNIFVGGIISAFGGTVRNYFASINVNTSTLNTLNPNPNGPILKILPNGATLYVGGVFSKIAGSTRNNIALISAINGSAFSWNPNTNGMVRDMAISGGNIFIAGIFTTIGGVTRNRIGAVNISSGAPSNFNPNADNQVYSIKVNGSKVFFGGQFLNVNGVARAYAASADTVTSTINSWNPNPNARVNNIELYGSQMLLGGNFTTINSVSRNFLASVDLNTGALNAWNPNPDNNVLDITVSGFNSYIGGNFVYTNKSSRNNIVCINALTGQSTAWNPNVDSRVRTLKLVGSTIYLGGDFQNVNGINRKYAAALNTNIMLVSNWNPSPNKEVYSIKEDAGIIYLGGQFDTIGGVQRNRIAAVTSSGSVTSWNPNISGARVSTINFHGNNVIVGGNFFQVGGLSKSNLAAINKTTGIATSWNPSLNQVNTSIVVGNELVIGGSFTSVNGNTRNRIAKFNLTTGALLTWNPSFTGTVNSIHRSGSLLLVGGSFGVSLGITRGTTLINYFTGSPLNSNLSLSNISYAVSILDDKLISAGLFTTASDLPKRNLACWNTCYSQSIQNVSACNSYTWSANNQTYTSSGYRSTVLTNNQGCDSVVTLNLIIKNTTSSTSTVSACDSYTWSANNQTYTNSGVYNAILVNSQGCDSLLTLILTIKNATSSTSTISACDSYTWSANNQTYTNSGVYNTTLVNSQGCDSLLTLNLIIKNATSSTSTATACDSYTWSANNQTYTNSGVYNTTLVNSQGCDSLLTLNLTIKNTTSSTLTVSACDSYTWSANNQTYTNSGVYNTTLVNSQGCDSLLTLNLTIKNATSSTSTVTSCDSYTWTANNQTYTNTGIYNTTLVNSQGCDSLLTLNLTINYSSASSISVTSCETYTWSENNQTYNQSGSYSTTLINSLGCDSVITLNLSINSSTSSTTLVTACDSIEINGQTFDQSGTYSQTLINSFGCDSIITLQITINHSTYSLTSETACDSYTWTANNQTYTNSGVYNTTLVNSQGCDSLMTLELTINPLPVGQISNSSDTMLSVSGTENYQWFNCMTSSVITGETSEVFFPTSNGSYAVIMTTVDGCIDTTDCELVSTLLINDDLLHEVKVYPNPTAGDVRIDADGLKGELLIFDHYGKLIQTLDFSDNATLDFSVYSNGMYFIRFQSYNLIYNLKVEKTN